MEFFFRSLFRQYLISTSNDCIIIVKYFFKVFKQKNFNNFLKHILLSKLISTFYLFKFNFRILTPSIRLTTKIKDISLILDEF